VGRRSALVTGDVVPCTSLAGAVTLLVLPAPSQPGVPCATDAI
jgi:hypothetical protein